MSDLVIDSANNDLVMAMSHAHFQPINLDTIHNKGEGQVILLHGPPGVGKTFTVECIATTTGRPLIALTLGDLLAEESKVEETLLNWFTLAERWKAILLLDEADIFLERRASKDIQRNGIVSMFLRRMEYFRGTLFLTTNRVGQIDDAFLSRVSVVLQYDRLSDDTRKRIWQGFFRKLRKDTRLSNGRKVEVDKYAEKYVLNDPVVRDLSWNGREIRNALQTAIHLASYKGLMNGDRADETVDVGVEHFESVVAMSLKFKDYMQAITGQDEDERAKARSERNIVQ